MFQGSVVPVLLLAILPLYLGRVRPAFAWVMGGIFLLLLGTAGPRQEWEMLANAPTSFLAVSAGFSWLGFGLLGYGWWVGWRGGALLGPPTRTSIALALLLLAVIVAMLADAWPLLYLASWRGPVVALGLGATGAVLALLFGWLKLPSRIQALDDRWLARTHPPAPALSAQAELFTWCALLAAVLLVLLSHALIAFGLGAFAFVVAAQRVMRQRGKSSPIPLRPILAIISLFVFYFAVRTIAGGDIPLRFPGILETPFSFAAEASLALVIGLGAWVMLGLWPFHGAGAGSAAAIVGGAFLIRWGNGLIPDGMAHAAPLFAIVAMVAALHAAATGRVGEYAGALGVLAVTTPHRMAWAFFGVASCLALVRLLPNGGNRVPLCPPGLDRRQFGAILLIPILGVALPSMLRGESFQTAVAVLAGVPLVLGMRE